MKKIILISVFFLITMSIQALNPPSYVGRNIHEVLKELEGVKVQYEIENTDRIGYSVFIDDTKTINFTVGNNIIINVQYERIYYNSSAPMSGEARNNFVQRDIFLRLKASHQFYLGNPRGDADNGAYWTNSAVGTYFMNPLITSYHISIGWSIISEVWTSR